jgi:hypothetical protein
MAWQCIGPLEGLPRVAQWGILLAASAVLGLLLIWARLPAALMLGPMVAAILIETGGGSVRVPDICYSFAQAVIGCMIARAVTAQIVSTFQGHWPLFLGIALTIVAVSCIVGWLISRLGILPDTTAVWGLLPGAAPVMMLMADAFGADGRLVACMQYLRVVLVAIAASIIARFWVHPSSDPAPVPWFAAVDGLGVLGSLLLVLLGMLVGKRIRIPAGTLLVPMAIGGALHGTGMMAIELPRWFLAASFALLGWNTGLRFNRDILRHAWRVLPQIIVTIVLMMAICGALALLLVRLADVDLLTAYLATSPGGVDSAAIIAASSTVDLPFVMTMQMARFLMVLLVGPAVASWVATSLLRGLRSRAGTPGDDTQGP